MIILSRRIWTTFGRVRTCRCAVRAHDVGPEVLPELISRIQLKIRRVQLKVFPPVPIGSTAGGIACDKCECLIGINAQSFMFFLSGGLLLTSPCKSLILNCFSDFGFFLLRERRSQHAEFSQGANRIDCKPFTVSFDD